MRHNDDIYLEDFWDACRELLEKTHHHPTIKPIDHVIVKRQGLEMAFEEAVTYLLQPDAKIDKKFEIFAESINQQEGSKFSQLFLAYRDLFLIHKNLIAAGKRGLNRNIPHANVARATRSAGIKCIQAVGPDFVHTKISSISPAR